MSIAPDAPYPHFPVRGDWLALHDEPVLEPDCPIVDAHHHLWDRPGNRYFLSDFLEDAASGHRIEASVFMECGAMYRRSGPPELRCVGETEFANGCAAMAASGAYGDTAACAAIVGYGDLLLGDALAPVLEAQLRAGGERFRGVRQIAAWHRDPAARGSLAAPPPGLLAEPRARAGMAALARAGLSFDTFLYHTQLTELADLARTSPDVTIVANHVGGAIGIGPYAERRDEVFAAWRAGLLALAESPNACIKLGGLGMRVFGHDFGARARPPSSEELAAAWGPYIETCIEIFGVQRCMFESNFPVDKGSCGYRVLWNGFKRIVAGASSAEKAALFRDTASRVYGLFRDSP
jgi:predicted TIM-barrel fold metal-dependent hydrolase